MPARTRLSAYNCSLARALDEVGDWWSLLIVRDALAGVRRFGAFRDSLGIAKNILSARLTRLTDAGILDQTEDGGYQPTDKGRALFPALVALMQWGDAFLSNGHPPMIVADERGDPVLPVAVAGRQGPVRAADAVFTAGPGANPRTKAFLKTLKRTG